MKKYIKPSVSILNVETSEIIAASLSKNNTVGDSDQLTREHSSGWNAADWQSYDED